jgi:hypothetical protein
MPLGMPGWAIGTALGVLGIALSIVFYIRGRRVKRPTYAIRSANLVRDLTGSYEGVTLLYRGNRIPTLTATKVAFWNAGRDTIDKSDIPVSDPLAIVLSEEGELLDARVVYRSNSSNELDVHIKDGRRARLSLEYLDYQQGGVIQILHTGSERSLSLQGAVKGAGSPRLRKSREYFPVILGNGVFVASFAWLSQIYPIRRSLLGTLAAFAGGGLITVAILLLTRSWYRPAPPGYSAFRERLLPRSDSS